MLKLVIGNKNYSSWSLRAWLALHAFDVPFTEKLESLNHPNLDEQLANHSPSAKVPVLIDDEIIIWDSLAIAEYVAENHAPSAYPQDKKQRAEARSISAEMHSSFSALRRELPMNIRASRDIEISAKAQRDIHYIDQLWKRYSTTSKEGWLFDTFSIADCMYAPVASRFKTYHIELSPEAHQYQQKLLNHSSIIAWSQQAHQETEIVPVDEAGTERPPPT